MDSEHHKKRTKILYVITKSNWGGAQRYVYDLATSLSPLDYEVVVAFGEGGILEDKLKHANIRTIRIESLQRDVNIFKDFAVCFELYKIFRREKPNVVHLNSSKIGGIGGVAGRLARIPKIIFTGHGWAFNEDRNALSKFLITIAHWITITLAHQTIAVSEATAVQIKTLPWVAKKIVVIHHGISPIVFEDRAKARHILATHHSFLKSHQQSVEEALWIGTISELHRNKGLDILIKAFAQIAARYAEVYLIIIGEGQERHNLERAIQNHGLATRIFLLGAIPDGARYLKAIDIFTLTSRTESLGYVLLEAGLAKLPVVTSAVGGIPEIVDSHITGLLTKPENSGSVAAAIVEYIQKPEFADEMAQALYKKVSTNFSLHRMIEKTVALYHF